MSSVRGKVVAITGGGRGIGLAIGKILANAGAKVSLGDIDSDLAKTAAQSLQGFGTYLDVRQRESFATFLAETQQALGEIDILINNAGIMPMGSFLDEDFALSDTQIDINLRGVVYGMKLALPNMLARQQGHIINVASLAGRFAIPGAAVYTGTKFAIVGLTEAVACEYRDSGVNFTVVMPSKVRTELTAGTEDAEKALPTVDPEDVAEAVFKAILQPEFFVAVPSYINLLHGVYSLLPTWVQQTGRRVFDDTRLLTKLDNKTRGSYSERLQRLAANNKPS